MLDHDHLRDRAGEKVHIISTYLSGQIKEDGEKDKDPSKYRHIVHHVNSYLDQDMVSVVSIAIPLILISNAHSDQYDFCISYLFRLICWATIGI